MNELSDFRTINRVLIALDAFRKDQAILDIAMAFAASKRVELMTLFIEDPDLVSLASLPFVQEIDTSSTRERKLDSLQLMRAFRSQTQQLSRRLEQMTRQSQLRYSLKIVRGHYVHEALSATVSMDVLFLSRSVGRYARRTPKRSTGRQLPFSQHRHPAVSNAVWVFYDGTATSNRALSMACDLAASSKRELVIVIQATEDQTERLKQQCISIVSPLETSAHYVTVTPETGDEDLLNLLYGRDCGILVLSGDDASGVGQRASNFMEVLECPVVLVR